MTTATDCGLKLPVGYIRDVQEFLTENKIDKTIHTVTCEEFFRYYCQWNGIFWDSALWELAKMLLDPDVVGLEPTNDGESRQRLMEAGRDEIS